MIYLFVSLFYSWKVTSCLGIWVQHILTSPPCSWRVEATSISITARLPISSMLNLVFMLLFLQHTSLETRLTTYWEFTPRRRLTAGNSIVTMCLSCYLFQEVLWYLSLFVGWFFALAVISRKVPAQFSRNLTQVFSICAITANIKRP